jgi:phosphotransferase system enzyme I (PtsI)
MPAGSVLVARHLFPSDTVYLSRASTVAVSAEFAGRAAHAALLARELGIPCVGGIANVMEQVHASDDIIVDGGKGIALIDADSERSQLYDQAIADVRSNASQHGGLREPARFADPRQGNIGLLGADSD